MTIEALPEYIKLRLELEPGGQGDVVVSWRDPAGTTRFFRVILPFGEDQALTVVPASARTDPTLRPIFALVERVIVEAFTALRLRLLDEPLAPSGPTTEA